VPHVGTAAGPHAGWQAGTAGGAQAGSHAGPQGGPHAGPGIGAQCCGSHIAPGQSRQLHSLQPLLPANRPHARPRRMMIRFVIVVSLSATPEGTPETPSKAATQRRWTEIQHRQCRLASLIGRKTRRIEKIAGIATFSLDLADSMNFPAPRCDVTSARPRHQEVWAGSPLEVEKVSRAALWSPAPADPKSLSDFEMPSP
jgi:hypothetical protein